MAQQVKGPTKAKTAEKQIQEVFSGTEMLSDQITDPFGKTKKKDVIEEDIKTLLKVTGKTKITQITFPTYAQGSRVYQVSIPTQRIRLFGKSASVQMPKQVSTKKQVAAALSMPTGGKRRERDRILELIPGQHRQGHFLGRA